MAVPHEYTRDARPSRSAHEPVARHAGVAADEPRPTRSPTGLVRPRRARQLAAAPAAPHGRDRESEIEQSGRARLPGTEPARDAVRPRRRGDALTASNE